MANIKKAQQLSVKTKDKPGMLSEVTDAIASVGVNIDAICAYAMQGEAVFYLITADNAKVKNALSAKGWQVDEAEVVIAELENKPGALKEAAAKLKAKNVNLEYCYGSTSQSNVLCRLILKSENNNSIIEALK